MKTNILKIFAIATLMVFIGAGVSMADGWKNESGNRGHAYGHYKQKEYHHYRICAKTGVCRTSIPPGCCRAARLSSACRI